MASQNTSKLLVELPKEFKKKTAFIAMGAIVFFIIYFAFVAFFIWLLKYTFSYSLLLLEGGLHVLTILIAIGANGFVAMILILLLKMFIPSKKSNEEDEVKLEIFAKDYPKLFEVINEVADNVNTYRPRKVFLIPDVNASVIHEQNFMSLFKPSHQNLNIGLGLVNSVSVDELKAILAHEFGHFSQNVTRVSGFTYRINRLIVSILYTDDSWYNAIQQASSISLITSIFGGITLYTAAGIRWVFQKVYEMVNLSFLSLSRDLEFHADAIAVSLMGQEPLINSLRKIDFTNLAYSNANAELSHYLEKEKLTCTNFYTVHQNFTEYIAGLNNLPVVENQPVVTKESLQKLVATRVSYDDQWASHPTQEEREANILKHGESRQYDKKSAWVLFPNPEKVQEELTSLIYKEATKEAKDLKPANTREILDKIEEERRNTTVNPVFNDFYLNREIEIDIEEALKEYTPQVVSDISFKNIYTTENRKKIERLFVNKADKEVLTAIKNKEIKVSFFEFAGKKYKRKQIKDVLKMLEDEINTQIEWLLTLDKKAFWLNLYEAEKRGEETKKKYLQYFEEYTNATSIVNVLAEYANFLNLQLLNFNNIVQEEDDLKPYLANIRSAEKKMKNRILELKIDGFEHLYTDEEKRKAFVEYVTDNSKFFINLFSINEESVNKSFNFLSEAINVINPHQSKMLKQLSDLQAQWVKEH